MLYQCGWCYTGEYLNSEDLKNNHHCLVIVASHHCVVPQNVDPGCDLNSGHYAERIREVAGGTLVLSRTPRAVCDNNRYGCSSWLKRELDRINAYRCVVLDVHSFRGNAFKLAQVTETVILGHGRRIEWTLARELHNHGISVAVLKAAADNYVTTKYSYSVLLEMREDLPDSAVTAIGEAVKAWHQKIN